VHNFVVGAIRTVGALANLPTCSNRATNRKAKLIVGSGKVQTLVVTCDRRRCVCAANHWQAYGGLRQNFRCRNDRCIDWFRNGFVFGWLRHSVPCANRGTDDQTNCKTK
jgi:hypothetical protein